MNSEQLRVISEMDVEVDTVREQRVSKVAHDMFELVEMPGWKLLVQDIGGIKDNLIKALLDAKTLKETQMLQGRIKNIDLFINTPSKYISQSKSYLNRRDKWQKK